MNFEIDRLIGGGGADFVGYINGEILLSFKMGSNRGAKKII